MLRRGRTFNVKRKLDSNERENQIDSTSIKSITVKLADPTGMDADTYLYTNVGISLDLYTVHSAQHEQCELGDKAGV